MRVGLYLRVSTLDQVEGFSLEAQNDRLTAFCKSQGWDDTTIYMDDGKSGTDMDRPALKRLIRHCEEKKIQAVVVLKLDRLSRKQKDVLYLLEEVFEKNNVIFKSATEPFDTSTPLGKAMLGILAVFAQLERDMIVERTVIGKMQRVIGGKWNGGHAPFGYRYNEDTEELEVVEDQADIVRKIYAMFVRGESLNSISIWAQERVSSRFFHNRMIKDIIKRPLYIGKVFYSGSVYDSDVTPIMSEDDWKLAQIELKRRDEGLKPRGSYLLTGLCRCGICGSSIVHESKTRYIKGSKYYSDYMVCHKQKYKPYDCTMGYLKRQVVEDFIINEIKTITNDVNKVKVEDDNAGIIKALESRIATAEQGLENLYEAIQNGIVKPSAVAQRIKDLEDEMTAAEKQLDDIKDSPNIQRVDVSFIKQIGEAWHVLDHEEQKTVIRNIILGIKLYPKGKEPEIMWNTNSFLST